VSVSEAPEPGSEWPSLGIVVPVYNEAATIERACREIAAVAERYRGRAVVIAVDDGSADRSAAILAELAGGLEPLDTRRHSENAGYGAALRTGAERAHELGLDYVAFIDSDLTNPPEDLLKIGQLAAAGHDYIKGSRFVAGGSMAGVPGSRRAVSRAGNVVGQALFGAPVRDVTNGFRAVRTDLFLSWPLRERGFAVIVEELDWALRSGVEPAEFPTVLTARSGEQRATAFSYSPRLVLSYLRYPMRAFGRRVRTPGGGKP
jgi:glycosyltransferase involved in cell wall biosynthesis